MVCPRLVLQTVTVIASLRVAGRHRWCVGGDSVWLMAQAAALAPTMMMMMMMMMRGTTTTVMRMVRRRGQQVRWRKTRKIATVVVWSEGVGPRRHARANERGSLLLRRRRQRR
jgi:hypothetical protein